jgi:hypothetical protein
VAGLARFDQSGAAHLDLPSAEPIGPARAPSYREILAELWPAGTAAAIADTWRAAERGESPAVEGQYHLTLTAVVKDLTDRCGPVRLLHRDAPAVLGAADVVAAG